MTVDYIDVQTGELVTYQPKTKPFEHQARILEETYATRKYALFWEMGCGKTKPVIDTIACLYAQGEIDGAIVVAPNGVHRNWVTQELTAHMPDHIKWTAFAWDSARKTNKEQLRLERVVLTTPYCPIVAMTYEGFCTEAGKKFAKTFLTKRTAMMVLDEAHRVKTPSAERSRVILAATQVAKYVRVLTGTPVANSPFDVYNLMRMLDPDFWHQYGITTFSIFKQEFANFTTIQPRSGRSFAKVTGYKHLDQLNEMIKPYSDRLLKDDVLDLPPKVYTRLVVELSPRQREVYQQLVQEFRAELQTMEENSGEEGSAAVEAPHAMTRILRLQQVVCGYAVAEYQDPDSGEIKKKLVHLQERGENPRINALLNYVEDVPHQAIIWARFQEDIRQICEALGDEAVRYDGTTSAKDREIALERFRSGTAKFFVANPAAAGTGLTLTQAKTVIYYSNSFNLVERLQSEDRAHRIGQTTSVQYVDITCDGTVDARIVTALVNKFDVAATVMGDGLRDWL